MRAFGYFPKKKVHLTPLSQLFNFSFYRRTFFLSKMKTHCNVTKLGRKDEERRSLGDFLLRSLFISVKKGGKLKKKMKKS